VEVRSIWTSTELCGYLDFPYAAQVFTIRREVTEMVAQKSRCETVQGLSSLPAERATPAGLLALSRGHWTIENRLHWVRDVTFDEDRSRVRTGAGAQVMASIRNLAISLLRLAGARYIAPALRRCARSDPQALRLIGLRL
jgi:hypothetical protein